LPDRLINRVILIVLDSAGIGWLPDADKYGDTGSHTLGNTARAVGGLQVPNLAALGLGNIVALEGVAPVSAPKAAWGKMAEKAPGKDTTTGHWELCGLVLKEPFPVYPDGFPAEVITAFEAAVGRRVLGNKAASGTAIIEELGAEHLKTGRPIVYTSADSVFQIAAHEEVISVEELYRLCRIAREILQGRHGVGRVIARPFTGKPGAFVRTAARRDFSLPPTGETILDVLTGAGYAVWAVGKIWDIFAGRGVTRSFPAHGNDEVLATVLRLLGERPAPALLFANCNDFDMLWGHRNDAASYAEGLRRFDQHLPKLLAELREDDLLVITADHGCDPTTPSTDHSREYVPLLVCGPLVRPRFLGVRETFADVAATLADIFGVGNPGPGQSFCGEIFGTTAKGER